MYAGITTIAMPHVHAAVIYVVTVCHANYSIETLQQLYKVQESALAPHSLSLSGGHAELLILLLLLLYNFC